MDNNNHDEYEETLIYVDLDDIPSVDELFAVEPDDFLTCQSKRQREIPQPKKPLHPQLALKFYNLESNTPILQVGSRFYSGEYEEPMGSYLMFQDKITTQQEKDSSTNLPSSSSAPRSRIARLQQRKKFPSAPRTSSKLKSIIPELKPPTDKVYGEKLCTAEHPEYELVANVHKVLRMRRTEVFYDGETPLVLPPTPGGQPAPIPNENLLKTRDIISGKYHMDRNIIPTTSSSSSHSSLKVKSLVTVSSTNHKNSTTTTTTHNTEKIPTASTLASTDNIATTLTLETVSTNDSTPTATSASTINSSKTSNKTKPSTKSTSKTVTVPKTSVKTVPGKPTTTTKIAAKTPTKTSGKRKTVESKISPTATTSTRPTRSVRKK